ncbi:MAG: fibro-slime domain-containing protein [Planctomycetes bacterium]|nr:fibro-slime domain-containing protein [Planctomycetota bacterium]
MKLGRSILAAALAGAIVAPSISSADNITLTGTVRDFKRGDQSGGHQDFETCSTSGHGTFGHVIDMVTYQLGSDGKPVFNTTRPSNNSMYSAQSFGQWYNNVAGVNMSMPFAITLSNGKTTKGGVYSYSTNAFFPIDGLLWGNQSQKDSAGKVRNFSFTYELNTKFTYTPGQNFMFTGDDDVFVYINGVKVLDLGGVHAAVTGNVILFDGMAFSYNASTQFPTSSLVKSVSSTYASQLATKWTQAGLTGTCPIKSGDRYIDLALTSGKACTLDFFFAERHVTESNFRIDTSLQLQEAKPLEKLYD